jgi:bifunctional DNA-binding transcriptional regulator/antitoxin component of YhaV-PrlF toxin-antitoxin module
MSENISKVYWKRKINRIQDSLYVCIPKEYADSMGLAKGDILNLTIDPQGSLIIRRRTQL